MVPAAFVLLAALPLTSNGRVDRSRLPAPEEAVPRHEPPAAPASELERAVAAVWQEVLGTDGIGIDDNFFDLGGNSYLMIQAQGRLRERLGRELSVAELFEHTTVRSIAQHLSRQDEDQPVLQRGRERAEARRGAIRERAVARR
jgi:acyl carrier protein